MAAINTEKPDVEAILNRSIDRYIQTRRDRIPEFVDKHFSVSGSLKLHRTAIGLDLVRAPVNVVMSLVSFFKNILGSALRLMKSKKLSDRLRGLNLFLETDMGRELTWLLQTDFLELPYKQGDREFKEDALLVEILKDPAIEQKILETLQVISPHKNDPEYRQRLEDLMCEYVNSRVAAADITVSLLAAASSLVVMEKFTPGAVALSTSLAGSYAHAAAVSSFWAGPWLGGIYYGVVGVSTSPWLVAGIFSGLIIPISVLSAFAGVVVDPIQRKFGLHQKRLNNLVTAVETILKGGDQVNLKVRDQYYARILDIMDWAQAIKKLSL